MAQKADVELTVAEPQQAAAAELKAGQSVQLSLADDGGVACTSASGQELGGLPQELCPPLVRGAASATIRSIRRAGGGGAVTSIQLRVTAAAPAAHAPLQGWDDAPREAQDTEKDFRLPRGSLELLASSEEVRQLLQHQALRNAIAGVDAAPRPEQALERALQNPDFNAFAEKVLATIGRGAPEADLAVV